MWSGHRDDDGNLNFARDFCRRARRVISRMLVFIKDWPWKWVGEKAGQECRRTLMPALLRWRPPRCRCQAPGFCFLWEIRNREWLCRDDKD